MKSNDIKEAASSELVAYFNELTGRSIKKFENRSVAEKRVAEAILASGGKFATKSEIAAAKEITTLRPAGKPVKKGLPGPNSKLTGKKLYKLVEVNPRREGTLGHASFSIIVSGMSYEDYRLKGGRSNDLAWDIAHGFVEVK